MLLISRIKKVYMFLVCNIFCDYQFTIFFVCGPTAIPFILKTKLKN